MKKISAREFARNQAEVIAALKTDQTLAVTKRGKTVFLVSKPASQRRRRLRRGEIVDDLRRLPMTEADGEEILQKFVGEAIF
jgi:antitoxin (DNA-binding transcriptional repressor) of toxin-antitoxin stability system